MPGPKAMSHRTARLGSYSARVVHGALLAAL